MKEVKQMIKKLERERERLWNKLDLNRKKIENARDELHKLEVEQERSKNEKKISECEKNYWEKIKQ